MVISEQKAALTMKKVKDKSWKDYSMGTKAFSIGGGFWQKVERGWKWCTGDTFPTPGADAYWVEEPTDIQEGKYDSNW